ncbi:hypothetical protein [Micromonospora haikouensis]|uniref:hypothetical protein n=1 Tax=Micromonospora haikouensis TaxID=686309 RepID=UPI003D72405B
MSSTWPPPAAVGSRIPAGSPAPVHAERAKRLRAVEDFRARWLADHPDANADDLDADPEYAAAVRRLLAGD